MLNCINAEIDKNVRVVFKSLHKLPAPPNFTYM